MKRIVGCAVGVLVFGTLAASGWAAPRGSHAGAQPKVVQLAPQLPPAQGKERIRKHQLASTNWSGVIVRNSTFSDVRGSWTEPPATPDPCSNVKGRQLTVAAFWAGLDGWDSRTVEQAGTDEECIGATRVDVAWIEFYPARPIVVSTDVQPGDSLTAHVYQDGTNVYANVVDSNQGLDETLQIPVDNLAFNSAEWIAEAPTNRLTDFGSVDFTDAYATDNTGEHAMGYWDTEPITMYTKSGGPFRSTVRAFPTDFSDTGFTDIWEHS
jgi:Peptidase A4 family